MGLTFDSFTAAGTLDYALGTAPNTGWASAAGSVPPSDTTGQHDVLASTGPIGRRTGDRPGRHRRPARWS